MPDVVAGLFSLAYPPLCKGHIYSYTHDIRLEAYIGTHSLQVANPDPIRQKKREGPENGFSKSREEQELFPFSRRREIWTLATMKITLTLSMTLPVSAF
jgi:hypothetical protein